jgi:hypothetical protein
LNYIILKKIFATNFPHHDMCFLNYILRNDVPVFCTYDKTPEYGPIFKYFKILLYTNYPILLLSMQTVYK